MNVYPIFLNNLAGRLCVVIGSGHEAERKIDGLLDCDADVVVITPALSPELKTLFDAGRIAWKSREYQSGDLRNAFLAIATDPAYPHNAAIWEEAEANNVLLNAMDDVRHCSFVAGSVVRRGDLVISISTSGCAPALSVRMRQKLEKEFGPEYGLLLSHLKKIRPDMMRRFENFEDRREKWYQIVDSDLLQVLKAGELDRAEHLLNSYLG